MNKDKIIEQYKSLMHMLESFNKQLEDDAEKVDINKFAEEHKSSFGILQAQQANIEDVSIDDKLALELENIIVKIKEEEQKTIGLLQKEQLRVKAELTRIQGAKRAQPNYNSYQDKEARFIDKCK